MKNPEKMTFDEILNDNQESNEKITITQQKNHFVVIPETLYKINLNIFESGLLWKLTTRAPTFNTTLKTLSSVLKCNKEQIIKASKGLKEKGILTIENNFKGGSKWIIHYEPIINKINKIDENNIIESLIDGVINTKELKQLWKQKYIDYSMYQRVLIAYRKEIDRLIHLDIYNIDDD